MYRIDVLCVVFILLCAIACVPAAISLQQHRVRVVDAETGAPIPDAAIDLHYFPSMPDAPDPNHPRATANAQGEIVIRSTVKPAIWQVRAVGYIEQRLSSQEGALPPRYAANATGSYDGIIHLYRLPEPQLTILVNETYTGPLTLNLQPAPGFAYVLIDQINVAFVAVDPQASYIQEAPGRRVFTATASIEGDVDLTVTPLLFDIETHQLQIRDSTGVLPYRDIANPQDTERGVWGSVSEDDKRLHHQIRLFVGNLEEYRNSLEHR